MIVDWVTIKWAAKSCMVGLRVLLNTVQFLNKGNGEPQAIDSGVSVLAMPLMSADAGRIFLLLEIIIAAHVWHECYSSSINTLFRSRFIWMWTASLSESSLNILTIKGRSLIKQLRFGQGHHPDKFLQRSGD